MMALLNCKWWTGTAWDTAVKTKFYQFTCCDPYCKSKVCTNCVCNLTKWISKVNWAEHYAKGLLEQMQA